MASFCRLCRGTGLRQAAAGLPVGMGRHTPGQWLNGETLLTVSWAVGEVVVYKGSFPFGKGKFDDAAADDEGSTDCDRGFTSVILAGVVYPSGRVCLLALACSCVLVRVHRTFSHVSFHPRPVHTLQYSTVQYCMSTGARSASQSRFRTPLMIHTFQPVLGCASSDKRSHSLGPCRAFLLCVRAGARTG